MRTNELATQVSRLLDATESHHLGNAVNDSEISESALALAKLISSNNLYAHGNCFARTHRQKGRVKLFAASDAVQHLQQGFTLQVRNLQGVLDACNSIVQFARCVEIISGRTLESVSAFLTPANSQSLRSHTDRTGVVTIQLAATKTWFTGSAACFDNPSQLAASIRLSPGDILVIPAGVWHCAIAGDEDALGRFLERQASDRLGIARACRDSAEERWSWKEQEPRWRALYDRLGRLEP